MPRPQPPYVRELGFSLRDEMEEFRMTHVRHLEELRDAREGRIYKHSRSDTVSKLYRMQDDGTMSVPIEAAEAVAESGETEASSSGEVKKEEQKAIGGHSAQPEVQKTEGSQVGQLKSSNKSSKEG